MRAVRIVSELISALGSTRNAAEAGTLTLALVYLPPATAEPEPTEPDTDVEAERYAMSTPIVPCASAKRGLPARPAFGAPEPKIIFSGAGVSQHGRRRASRLTARSLPHAKWQIRERGPRAVGQSRDRPIVRPLCSRCRQRAAIQLRVRQPGSGELCVDSAIRTSRPDRLWSADCRLTEIA